MKTFYLQIECACLVLRIVRIMLNPFVVMTPATGGGLVECHLETSVSSCLQWLSTVRPASITLFLWISSRCTTEPDEEELMSLLLPNCC